ncbi:Alpha-(1,3)-fucosyltransferase 11 [Lamellibrachia satsuma]|nr:Alpha-(1,3)-fucosyltransferase 11 [Lamellibrachia satsuma]
MPKELRDPTESLGTEKFDSFLGRYKFHLAFENAICNDYMTEKLFRPLHVGSVPIYKGSPLARDWMPDNRSVIMIDDFESPQKLAEFIKYLDSNDTEYERYLQFKTSTGITNRFLLDHMLNREWGVNDFKKLDMITGFECYVCHKLTERYKVEKRHKTDPSIPLLPPVVADISHLHCPQPHPAFIDETKLDTDDSWRHQRWIEDYWDCFDKARAVRAMLERGEKKADMFEAYWEEIFMKKDG